MPSDSSGTRHEALPRARHVPQQGAHGPLHSGAALLPHVPEEGHGLAVHAGAGVQHDVPAERDDVAAHVPFHDDVPADPYEVRAATSREEA
ncbi:hypothetical protein, partial [Deinococcus pimensis]|uniref:hypothetical protein n=1 Tax=Deinococcus pimensis TaxID=309888 RepID=UPI001B7F8C1B